VSIRRIPVRLWDSVAIKEEGFMSLSEKFWLLFTEGDMSPRSDRFGRSTDQLMGYDPDMVITAGSEREEVILRDGGR
jgi:hypothetical protein